MDLNRFPEAARSAVFQESQVLPTDAKVVRGYDFNRGISYGELFKTYEASGFQATNFGRAVNEINKMLELRSLPLNSEDADQYEEDEFIRRKNNCTIFFGFTAEVVRSQHGTIKFLVQNKLIDCIVTSAGGVEDDFLSRLTSETLGPSYNDKRLRFEKFIMPLLDEMLIEQKTIGVVWTPSKVIERLGLRIGNEASIFYWAAKNKIPVFCPGFIDGSLGGLMASMQEPGLVLDILDDLRRINLMTTKALNSAIISIGAGTVKHHMCKANCVRDGADFAIYLNTAPEFDGSDSGAEPDESVACGKIKSEAKPVKIHGDASILLPFLVGETFARHHSKHKT